MEMNQNIFNKWLEENYTNKNTIRQYSLGHSRFMNYTNGNIIEQSAVNKFLAFARNKQHVNPFDFGLLKAIVDCYNELLDDDNQLVIKRDRSRGHKQKKTKPHKFIEKDELLSKIGHLRKYNYQAALMALIYFETGLRATELINIDLNDGRKWGWNLNERILFGIGKGNKKFEVHFSKNTAILLEDWLDKCRNPNKPFVFYKSNGTEYKNNYGKLIRIYKKYCDFTPHQIRHALGHFLRTDKNWDIELIRAKLRHEKITTTQIYVKSTQEELKEKEDREIFNI